MLINAQGYLIYNIAYLTLYPKYDCWFPDGTQIRSQEDQEAYCNPQYFCDPVHEVSWKVDWDADESLHNWISKYGLDCASGLKISSFGMLFFSGWTTGSFFLPRQADFRGRKKFYMLI